MNEIELLKLTSLHPPVLQRKVIRAFHQVNSVIELIGATGNAQTWLERYRCSNKSSSVAWFGLYPQLASYVEKLEEILQEITDYRPHDYISIDGRIKLSEKAEKKALKKNAHKGAQAMKAKDPVQKANTIVHAHWNEWQSNQSLYDSKAAFARVMTKRYNELRSSHVTIQRWCRHWERKP